MPPADAAPKKHTPRNVFSIGFLSLFGGISQDLFAPIFPLYLTALGFDKTFVGLCEGVAAGGASMLRLVAGFLTDRFGRRKPFIFLGYFLSLFGRALLAFVASAPAIAALRFLDGTGKGMKDPPKSALIADSTVAQNRGRSFGVARTLDTLGSVIGPLLLAGLLYALSENAHKYEIILLVTAVPLLATFVILRFFVVEAPARTAAETPAAPLPRRFYAFLAIALVFGIGNSSDAFLILRARDLGTTLLAIPLVYALFNLVYALASVPLGALSDRIGRERVIVLGWAAYALSYAGFALAGSSVLVWFLFAFYGLYYAISEGVIKAFIADLVGAQTRGRAYGIYATATGLMALPASLVAGFLWDAYGPAVPFYFGAAFAAAAAVTFFAFSTATKGETTRTAF